MKADALTQMKRICHSVRRDVPALRQPWADLHRARFVIDQAVVDRCHNEARAVVEHRLGVEACGIGLHRDYERALVGGSENGWCGCDEDAGRRGALQKGTARDLELWTLYA